MFGRKHLWAQTCQGKSNIDNNIFLGCQPRVYFPELWENLPLQSTLPHLTQTNKKHEAWEPWSHAKTSALSKGAEHLLHWCTLRPLWETQHFMVSDYVFRPILLQDSLHRWGVSCALQVAGGPGLWALNESAKLLWIGWSQLGKYDHLGTQAMVWKSLYKNGRITNILRVTQLWFTILLQIEVGGAGVGRTGTVSV